MIEIWKDIKGYEGIFQVSNYGKVRRLEVLVMARHGLAKYPEKEKKSYTTTDGYKRISLHLKQGRKKYLVHRLVVEAFLPNPLNLPHVNHIDRGIGVIIAWIIWSGQILSQMLTILKLTAGMIIDRMGKSTIQQSCQKPRWFISEKGK